MNTTVNVLKNAKGSPRYIHPGCQVTAKSWGAAS